MAVRRLNLRAVVRRPGVAALFVATAVSNQWRSALGQVPMAGDIVTQYPLFHRVEGVSRAVPPHANLVDVATQFYPFRVFAGNALRNGDLPLWNAHIMMGTPFLANIQSALLYPPNLLLYGLLPANAAWSLGFVLRPVLAAWFTWLFVRRLGASPAAAVVAGMSFAFSGFVTGWGGWPQADAVIWLPLMLWAVDRLAERVTTRHIAVTALTLAMPLLAGHPEVAFFTLLAAAAFGVFRLAFDCDRTSRRRFAVGLLAAAALGGGLMAAQILPTGEWVSRLERYHHPAAGSTALAVDEALSIVSRDAQVDPNSAGLRVSGVTSYVGMLCLVAAPLAWWGRRRRESGVPPVLRTPGVW